METIDKRVKKVLELENQKLRQAEKDAIDNSDFWNDFFESIIPEYTIAPIDTIGKNIYFNTVRR